jgi:hypothetical protein
MGEDLVLLSQPVRVQLLDRERNEAMKLLPPLHQK